jgi:hypothetical protein
MREGAGEQENRPRCRHPCHAHGFPFEAPASARPEREAAREAVATVGELGCSCMSLQRQKSTLKLKGSRVECMQKKKQN